MAIAVAKGSDLYAESVAGGASNAKGSWVELLASVGEDIGRILVLPVSSNNAQRFAIDIGVGAGGAEAAVVSDVMLQVGGDVRSATPSVYLPINIASGSRISGRVQSTDAASNTVRLVCYLIGDTVSPGSPVTYGITLASTTGVVVDPGAVVDTKGAYSEVTASTTADHNWVAIIIGSRENSAPASAFFAFDFATGAGGAESIQIPDVCFATNPAGDIFCPASFVFPLTIASGTRIAMRAASSTNDATDRLFETSVIGAETPPSSGGGSQHNYAF